MSLRSVYGAASLGLGAIAVWLPTAWYETIPRLSGLRPLPFSGVGLLRLVCLTEAILFAILAVRGTQYVSHRPRPVEVTGRTGARAYDLNRVPALWILGIVTIGGLWLRVHNLGLDLWLDEISPLVDYSRLSAAQVVGSYLRSNNHLLNTLLTRLSVSAFGQSEWSVRIPAVTFGVLTIPALYWVARLGLSRITALGAALLLACSYHHIFFSQNARGYTAYVLFALLSTGSLLRAARNDELRYWIMYIVFATLGMASLLLTAFVLTGHAILAALLLLARRRSGHDSAPLLRRFAAVFLIGALLAFQIYAAAIPEAYVTLTTVYSVPSTGFSLFSADFFNEMMRGVSAGFGSPLIALIFLLAGAAGFGALVALSWPLATGLVLPEVLTLGVLVAGGLTLSPRFFLLSVPLAMLSAVAGLETVTGWCSRRFIASARTIRLAWLAALVVMAAASLKSLPYYYRTPKQPYRAALAYADKHGNGAPVVVLANGVTGFKYYLARDTVAHIASRYTFVRTVAQFDSLSKIADTADIQLLTTFRRAIRIEAPGIDRELGDHWAQDTTFGATVGDGEITVWSKKGRFQRR